MQTDIEITIALKSDSGKIAAYKRNTAFASLAGQEDKHYMHLESEIKMDLHDIAESKDFKDLIAALAGDQEIRILIGPTEEQ